MIQCFLTLSPLLSFWTCFALFGLGIPSIVRKMHFIDQWPCPEPNIAVGLQQRHCWPWSSREDTKLRWKSLQRCPRRKTVQFDGVQKQCFYHGPWWATFCQATKRTNRPTEIKIDIQKCHKCLPKSQAWRSSCSQLATKTNKSLYFKLSRYIAKK